MQSVTLMIDETPYCVWDWELGQLDADFLGGIDPAYFEYMVKSHDPHLDGDDAQRAALAIRITYSHAMETLMSLLCATIQAPDCVIGWLHKYRNDELDSVVHKLIGRQSVPTKLKNPDLSWSGLSKTVHKFVSDDHGEKKQRVIEGFGKLWARIAQEFTDDGVKREYNSIKHGLRARSGGFVLRFGLEAVPGTPCPPDQMQTLGGSRFGSTYYVPEPVEGVEKCNLKIVSASRNWLPESLAGRTYLMSLSMRNVLSFLKIVNGGKPEEHQFVWPQDLTAFDEVWKYSTGVTGSSINVPVEREHITPLSKQQIVDRYNRAGGGDSADPA